MTFVVCFSELFYDFCGVFLNSFLSSFMTKAFIRIFYHRTFIWFNL